MDLHLASAWEVVSGLVPERDAVVQGDRRITWASYENQAARLAGAFRDLRVGPETAVGLYLTNCPEYLLAQFAALKLRGAPINVNYRYLDDELAYLLDYTETEVLVFHTSLSDRVERVRPRLPRLHTVVAVDDGGPSLPGALPFADLLNADPAPRIDRPGRDVYMLCTGGTTGMPKGVMYAHHDFTAHQYRNRFGIPVPRSLAEVPDVVRVYLGRTREVAVPACPLMHGTGMWAGAMAPHLRGGTVVLLESKSFDAHELWSTVEREAVASIVIVGDPFARPMLRALAEAEDAGQAYDISALRVIGSAGAMWSAEVKEGLQRFTDALLIDALGSTEGSTYAARHKAPGTPAPTASFELAPGARVVRDDGTDVEPGSKDAGMLASPAIALGYFKDPEKTAATFREIDGRRYVLTGDWATLGTDGNVTLLGRGSQCINTGGEKVFPEEVEEAIKTHAAVDDCLVVGVPDERFGQRVVAVVGAAAGLGENDLREWVRDRLSGYKIPRQVVVVDRVQRAPNGKADYGWARSVADSRFGV
ncbi:MAG: AMP-binding protein [Actinomycetota bacterium]